MTIMNAVHDIALRILFFKVRLFLLFFNVVYLLSTKSYDYFTIYNVISVVKFSLNDKFRQKSHLETYGSRMAW